MQCPVFTSSMTGKLQQYQYNLFPNNFYSSFKLCKSLVLTGQDLKQLQIS